MSPPAALKRALVKLLLVLARQFSITLSVTRDSPDEKVKKAFRKVIVRIHPDKPGGSAEHTKALNDAWAKWQGAQRTHGRLSSKGSSSASAAVAVIAGRSKPTSKKKVYRIRGEAVMLTYQRIPGITHWNWQIVFQYVECDKGLNTN